MSRIIINRNDVYKSTVRSVHRKKFSFSKPLAVTFAGEEAVDTGGPKREYLRLLMREVASLNIFNRGWFTHDLVALEKKLFRLAGQLTAWSILQGGSGPKCLSINIYGLISEKMTSEVMVYDDIKDEGLKEILTSLEKVQDEDAFSLFLDTYADRVCSYGYVHVYMTKYGDKSDIINALLRQYFKFSVLAEMQQFKDGMNSIGNFGDIIWSKPNLFEVVLGNRQADLKWNDFKDMFIISYSEVGSNKKNGEDETMYGWELFLQDISEKEVEITFEDLLVFITGANCVPPLGFTIIPCIEFYDLQGMERRLPWSSTCSNSLYLPRKVNPDILKNMILQSVHEGHGFG